MSPPQRLCIKHAMPDSICHIRLLSPKDELGSAKKETTRPLLRQIDSTPTISSKPSGQILLIGRGVWQIHPPPRPRVGISSAKVRQNQSVVLDRRLIDGMGRGPELFGSARSTALFAAL